MLRGGDKALQAELREGKLDIVRSMAKDQEENGAAILDVNMGLGGILHLVLLIFLWHLGFLYLT